MKRGRYHLQRMRGALQTIRVRLTLWYVALLAVIIVTFSTFLYGSLSRNLRVTIDEALTTQAQQIVHALDDADPKLSDAADQISPLMRVALYDATGTKLLGGDTHEVTADDIRARAAAAQGQQTLATITLVGGEVVRRLTVPVIRTGQIHAVLQIVRSEHDVVAVLNNLLLLMALAIPMTLLFAVGGGLFLAGRALNPIARITAAAAHIEADDLTARINFRGSKDEVGRLAATFDRMLARLEDAFRRQRQFTADASHELRTPLAILTTQVDVALEQPHSAEQYRAVLLSLRDDTHQMDQLLNQLLTLARADAGESRLAHERLDLTTLVDDIVGAMVPLAENRGVHLRCDWSAAAVTVDGDQTRLTQLLMNLVENGIKYTPDGGSVRVAVHADAPWAIIKVVDTGVGIAAEHLPHIFERFFRTDQARARAVGGTGLGLAISQWIVQAHGGTISVASVPGRETTFTVSLPLAVAQPTPGLSTLEMSLGHAAISTAGRPRPS